MVNNHMYWIPDSMESETGSLYAASPTGKLADLPSYTHITMTAAVELVSAEFPPRTAIRRILYGRDWN